ncbi:MAG: SoxH protein, homolog [uncultured Thiotrichaceae bacterium]|uniref:SoxH protein, homolog n=1 Tax=uncultured Thiotrichaceae bacterium TaxID=298394 RepID=A0A6S6U1J3_9GAMM|nr:MAG: SoxH protein, homolog [uncultured Thiotrichaceae bacterium]
MKPLINSFLIAISLWMYGGLVFAQKAPSAADQTGETETHYTREEVDHAFGTKAGETQYPALAIDTDEVPSVAFSAETSTDEPLKYYEIAPSTYFFYGNIAEVDENNRGFNGNAGFVVTDDSVVVIDSLGSPRLGKRILSTIKTVTDKPVKYLIITHNHPDHAYGAIAFKEQKGVIVVGHAGTMEYIKSDRIDHSVNYRNTFIKEDMLGFKPVKPDIMVGGELYSKQTLETGGKTFDIYNTGAHHSFGDLIVHQKEDNIVWISDLAFNNRVTFMADGSSEKAIDAQTWLLETFKDAKLMVPGHGSVQTSPFPMVSKTKDYMQRLRKDMTDAIEGEQDLQTTVDNTYYKDWEKIRLYHLNHKKNIDFVYRELELDLF